MDDVEPMSDHISYKKRFPAHHRRRNQVQREHERRNSHEGRESFSSAASSMGQPAAPKTSSGGMGLGILEWADSVLEEIESSGDWAQRKKHVRHRRYRILSL